MIVKLKGFKINVEAGELEYEIANPQDQVQFANLISAIEKLKEFQKDVENGEVKIKDERQE